MEKGTRRGDGRRRRKGEGDSAGIGGIASGAFLGVGVALAVMLALSAIFSGLCMLSPDPASLTLPAGIGAFAVSSVIGGAVSARGHVGDKTAALFSGLACGFSIMVFLGIAAVVQNLISPESCHGLKTLTAVLARSAAIPLSVAGAFIAGKRRKKRRGRK